MISKYITPNTMVKKPQGAINKRKNRDKGLENVDLFFNIIVVIMSVCGLMFLAGISLDLFFDIIIAILSVCGVIFFAGLAVIILIGFWKITRDL